MINIGANSSRVLRVLQYVFAALIGYFVGITASIQIGSGGYRYHYLLAPTPLGNFTTSEINNIRNDLNQSENLKRTLNYFDSFDGQASAVDILHHKLFLRQGLYQIKPVVSSSDSWNLEVFSPFQIPSQNLHQYLNSLVKEKAVSTIKIDDFDAELAIRRLEILELKRNLISKYFQVDRSRITTDLIEQFNRLFHANSYDILMLRSNEVDESKIIALDQDRQEIQSLINAKNQRKREITDEVTRVLLWQKFYKSLNSEFNEKRLRLDGNLLPASKPNQWIIIGFSMSIFLMITFIWHQRRYFKD